MKRVLFLLILLFPLTLLAADATTVILVRHAEAVSDGSQDPALSEAGQARAKALAALARDAQVAAVFVTQYRRTKDTAAELKVPLIETHVERGKIAEHAATVAKRIADEYGGKTAVVVGHSNTIPEIVKALSGASVTEIVHEEYDRVYVVVLGKPARVTVSRYGAPTVVAAKAAEPKVEMEKYFITFLRRGPAWTAERTPEVIAVGEGHMNNIRRLASLGKLVIAGPFLEQSGEGALAGLFIFRVPTIEEARELTESDPAVKAKRFTYEIVPWLGPKTLKY